ncbi:STIP1 [Mytilus edulis]|uniref:Stress-induced-phosphoprotein 1 n=1 Tax=Mytilus edulis TaxID=6550 RepID=A0A8S3T947_MYTED|nr:STIP1 [Mytilus edulis]
MIGTRTGMILDYSMKSRTCRICSTDRRINKIPNVKKKKKQDTKSACYRQNFSGSFKAMESDMAVLMVADARQKPTYIRGWFLARKHQKSDADPVFNVRGAHNIVLRSGAYCDIVLGSRRKLKGNEAYKKKDFDTAIVHYDKVIELDPKDITFRNNKAAVYFEMKEYDKCIETSEEAINIGRENRADYTLIAKALARAGKAFMKKEDNESALRYLNKSLSEHRNPEIQKIVQVLDKKIKEDERLKYIDPEKSLEAKTLGNDYFKKGDYPNAKKHYDEAIKRNPDDAKLYSNRAACYTKLLEFNLALKDADKCIELDPKFIKGYLRKGSIFYAMKEPSKAAQSYLKALDLDPNCEEANQGYRDSRMAEGNDPEAVRKRAMADPEVTQILKDPAMQLILQQMEKDPKAVREHLQNPEVAAKIEKLMECGIIALR